MMMVSLTTVVQSYSVQTLSWLEIHERMLLKVVLISCLALQSEALFGTPVRLRLKRFVFTDLCRAPPVAGTLSVEPSEELSVWGPPLSSVSDPAEPTL